MSAEANFTDMIRKVRAGDDRAAEALVRQYESLIRREVRLRLEDRRLTRHFDSMDVCQSVLASFFVRVAGGEYELDRPDQLVKLLVRMARNKLVSSIRKQSAQRRDHRRAAEGMEERMGQVAGSTGTPSQIVSGRELLDRVRQELTEEERRIAELRAEGLPWDAVAEKLGGTAQARRVQLSRALERAMAALGFEEENADA
jgi:RNA polymerase sigma-70 factor (ECF subfamily)